MFEVNDKKRIPAKLLFLICALIGAVCFVGIYGIRILDVTYVDWLRVNGMDLRQHFIGWCRFRHDPWHFPIGLIDSLSYPDSMSVMYTDSIPMFAVLFKLLGPVLPDPFQYFGLFVILSFALMGGFSSLLLRRFVNDDIICIIGSVFFVISPIAIYRVYYHTALSSQWIVIAALVLWVYDDMIKSEKSRIIYWSLISFICVGIHSYFLPMVGMILAATIVTRLYLKKTNFFYTVELFLSFCVSGLINIYILGGFYGDTSPSGPGLGTFNSNLNTFINSRPVGRLIPRLPLWNDFQEEGTAYLGAGILLLFAVVAAGMVFRLIRKVPEEAFHTNKIYGRITVLLVAVSIVSAVLPNISFNEKIIVWLPYPQIVEKLLGIFRSNGRLIWTATYILMTAAISFTAYTFRRYRFVAVPVIALALVLQITDLSETFEDRFETYTAFYETGTIWDEPEVSEFIDGKRDFIFLYTDNDITMQTGYYGYVHNMRQNNFYFARDIEDKVRQNNDIYFSELDNGNIRDDAVYVIKNEQYEEHRDYFDGLGADMMPLSDDHMIFKAKK